MLTLAWRCENENLSRRLAGGWERPSAGQELFHNFFFKLKTVSVLPKNNVLQIPDVSVPRSHSRNSLLTPNGQWVLCTTPRQMSGRRPVLTRRRHGKFGASN